MPAPPVESTGGTVAELTLSGPAQWIRMILATDGVPC
jgi:hypothetical protein